MIRNSQDFAFAMFLLAFGAAGLLIGWDLPSGSVLRMGPGYMPKALSGLIFLFGLLIALKACRVAGPSFGTFAWKQAALVIGSVFLFGALVATAGLALTVALACAVLAFAGHDRPSLTESVVFSIGLTIASVMLFGLVLKVGLPIWPR